MGESMGGGPVGRAAVVANHRLLVHDKDGREGTRSVLMYGGGWPCNGMKNIRNRF